MTPKVIVTKQVLLQIECFNRSFRTIVLDIDSNIAIALLKAVMFGSVWKHNHVLHFKYNATYNAELQDEECDIDITTNTHLIEIKGKEIMTVLAYDYINENIINPLYGDDIADILLEPISRDLLEVRMSDDESEEAEVWAVYRNINTVGDGVEADGDYMALSNHGNIAALSYDSEKETLYPSEHPVLSKLNAECEQINPDIIDRIIKTLRS